MTDEVYKERVKSFQLAHGCKVDGIVGPETWGAVRKAILFYRSSLKARDRALEKVTRNQAIWFFVGLVLGLVLGGLGAV